MGWVTLAAACLWALDLSAFAAPSGAPRFPGTGSTDKHQTPTFFDESAHRTTNAFGASLDWATPDAEVVHDDPVEAIEWKVVPLVERITGAPFLVIPPIAAEPRASVLRRLAAYRKTTIEELLKDEVIAQAIALYVPFDGRIYVMEEDGGDRASRRAEAAAQPDLPCVLAHELTHALQHQRAWLQSDPGDAERVEQRMVMYEGHASWVQGRVCGWDDDTRAALNPSWPRQPRPQPEDSIAGVRYGHGLRFVEAVADAWGDLAPWSFVADPPTLPELRRVTDLGLAPRWIDDDEITDVASTFGAPHDEVDLLTVPTGAMLDAMGLDVGQSAPRTAAHQASWYRDNRQDWLVLFPTGTSDAAANILFEVARQARLQSAHVDASLHDSFLGASIGSLTDVRVSEPRGRAKALGVDALVQVVYVTTGMGRTETWVRRGATVIQLAESGTPLDRRTADAALTALLARPVPTDTVDRPADPAQVRQLLPEPAPFPLSSVALAWFSGVAVPTAARQRDGSCLEYTQAVLDGAPADQRQRAAQVVHLCAVLGQDLALADTMRATLTDDALLAPARAAHAVLLSNANRWSDVDTLLRGWTPAEPEIRALVLNLDVEVAIVRSRWSEVIERAKDPSLDPAVLAEAGQALLSAGRRSEGRDLLDRACRILPDEERIAICR